MYTTRDIFLEKFGIPLIVSSIKIKGRIRSASPYTKNLNNSLPEYLQATERGSLCLRCHELHWTLLSTTFDPSRNTDALHSRLVDQPSPTRWIWFPAVSGYSLYRKVMEKMRNVEEEFGGTQYAIFIKLNIICQTAYCTCVIGDNGDQFFKDVIRCVKILEIF